MSTTTPNEKMQTLLGYSEVAVTFTNGEQGTVKVRQLPVRQLAAYLLKIDDEAGAVELFTNQPEGWADTLTLASFEAVLAEGEKLNSDSFFAWLRRRVERQERIAPGTTGDAGKVLLSRLPTSSQRSP
jgi:IS5 family transposase